MQVKRSIRTKFFAVSIGLVLVSVLAVALQNGMNFYALLSQQERDATIDQSAAASTQLSTAVDNWTSLVLLLLPQIAKEPTVERRQRSIDDFANSVVGLTGAVILRTDAFSRPMVSWKADGLSAWAASNREKTRRLQEGQKSQIDLVKDNTNALKENSIIYSLVLSQGESVNIWVILRFSEDAIRGLLPYSRFTRSFLVNSEGEVLTASQETKSRSSFAKHRIKKSLASKKFTSGFSGELGFFESNSWLAGFTKLRPVPELAVIVERDVAAAQLVILQSLFTACLWAALLLLVAIGISYITSKRITVGIRQVAFATQKIARGDFKIRLNSGSNDEVGMLESSINSMSRQIIELMKSKIEQSRLEKELETAKLVQQTFFPRSAIAQKNIGVAGFSRPATECGGDLWGHFTTSDGLEVVYIADAMGHGVPSALATAVAYSTCMTISDIASEKDRTGLKPSEILGRMNRVLMGAVEGKISMTCFVAIFDFEHGTMSYANAGHNFPFLIVSAKDKSQKKESASPTSIKLQGDPLGIAVETTYQQKSVAIHPGDCILMFTDGIVECKSTANKTISRRDLQSLLVKHSGDDPAKSALAFQRYADGFFAGRALDDDITLVVAKVNPNWKPLDAAHPAAESVATNFPESGTQLTKTIAIDALPTKILTPPALTPQLASSGTPATPDVPSRSGNEAPAPSSPKDSEKRSIFAFDADEKKPA